MLKLKHLGIDYGASLDGTQVDMQVMLDELLIDKAAEFVSELTTALVAIESKLLDVPELVSQPAEIGAPKKRRRKKKAVEETVSLDVLQKVVDNYIDKGKTGHLKRKKAFFELITGIDDEVCALEDLEPKHYATVINKLKNILDGGRAEIVDEDDDEV